MPDPVPHNLEAERALIGSMLIDPDAILRVREIGLREDDFFGPSLRIIYQAIDYLAARYDPVGIIAVSSVLSERKRKDGRSQLDEIGGSAVLTRLTELTPTTIHVSHYAAIVRQCAERRRVIETSGKIAQTAYEHEGNIDELQDSVSKLFFATIQDNQAGSHLYGTDEALIEYASNQQIRKERLEANPHALIRTGLSDLDRILVSLPPACLHVVVARSSIGKTMYLEQVAEYNARRGHRVVFYHLELTHQTMLDRRMARLTGVWTSKLMAGYDGPEISQAMDDLREWQEKMVYVHCPGWSAARISADIMRLRARNECDVAIVDYLQKFSLPMTRGFNAAMLIGQQAEILKTCAEMLEIPILLASQVSRDFKGRNSKRPRMEDIRNSGEIEEKANQVIVLHRPKERQEQDTHELTEIYVEKNTLGRLGKVCVLHVLGQFMFVSLSDEQEEMQF